MYKQWAGWSGQLSRLTQTMQDSLHDHSGGSHTSTSHRTAHSAPWETVLKTRLGCTWLSPASSILWRSKHFPYSNGLRHEPGMKYLNFLVLQAWALAKDKAGLARVNNQTPGGQFPAWLRLWGGQQISLAKTSAGEKQHLKAPPACIREDETRQKCHLCTRKAHCLNRGIFRIIG